MRRSSASTCRAVLGFIEALTLGMWHYAIRPGGRKRLPVFVQAFRARLEGTLLRDGPPESAT